MDKRGENTSKLVEYLQGTCINIDEGLSDLGLTEEDIDYDHLDMISLCEACGWWYDESEVDEGICENCRDN